MFVTFENGFGIRMAKFRGISFLTFLDFRLILDFWILKGSFLVCFLTFEILKMVLESEWQLFFWGGMFSDIL